MFNKPEIEFVEISNVDIVTASGGKAGPIELPEEN